MELSQKILRKRKITIFTKSRSQRFSRYGRFLFQWITHWRNAGVVGDRKGQSILGIRFMNSSSLVAATLNLVFGIPLSIISSQYIILYVGIPETLVFGLVIFLNSKHWYTVSTLLWELTFCLATLIFGVILRDVIDAITMLPFLVGAPWLVLLGAENRKKILPVCLAFALLTLIGMEVIKAFDLIPALPLAGFYWYFRPATAFTVLFLDVIVVWTVFKQYDGLLVKLARSNRRSRRATGFAKDFASAMTHELKSPLQTLQSITDRIVDPKVEKSEQENLIATSRSCIAHMSAVVSNVQVMSILDAGKQPSLEYEDTTIIDFMHSLVDFFRIEAGEKKVEILLQLDANLPAIVHITPTPLIQILKNLIDNAIKFSKRGGKVIIKAGYFDGHLVFTVRDYGMGIPRENLSKVFRKFYTTATQNAKGTGLGLFISRSLAQILGGEINVTSNLDHGTEFTVTLPNVTVKSISEELHTPGVRVLVIDDENLVAKRLSEMLEKHGCISTYASTAAESVKLAREFMPHVIIIDLNLTADIQTSAAVIEEIKNIPDLSNVSVVYISGDMLTNDQVTRLGENVIGFLSKPINPMALLRIISKRPHPVI